MQPLTADKLIVRPYEHNSCDDKKGHILRYYVLNLTSGVDDQALAFFYSNHDDEAQQIKLGAFIDETMVGTVCLVPKEENVVMIRQFAVFPNLQGMGIGRKLLDYAHTTAKALGYKRIILDARLNAAEFYAKAGYIRTGKVMTYPSVTLEQMYIDL